MSIFGRSRDRKLDSKKLAEPPKELPEIVPRQNKPAVPQPMTIKTEVPEISSKPLPIIDPRPQPKQPEHEVKLFEDAINNINIDVIHTDKPEEEEKVELYEPKGIGEGYFSEIEHYVKNKDVDEIMDDIIKKDFLTSMKDYHDNRSHGKTFYMHKEDLKQKLEHKMAVLRDLEEKWHHLNKSLEETQNTKRQLEKQIDEKSSELKSLFKQVKANQVLEKEAPQDQRFRLRTGQELRNLNDLRKALGYMSPEDFNFHVDGARNDFVAWVAGSLGLKDVSMQMKSISNKDELENFLNHL